MVALLLVEGGQYELERELIILSKSSSSLNLNLKFEFKNKPEAHIFRNGLGVYFDFERA